MHNGHKLEAYRETMAKRLVQAHSSYCSEHDARDRQLHSFEELLPIAKELKAKQQDTAESYTNGVRKTFQDTQECLNKERANLMAAIENHQKTQLDYLERRHKCLQRITQSERVISCIVDAVTSSTSRLSDIDTIKLSDLVLTRGGQENKFPQFLKNLRPAVPVTATSHSLDDLYRKVSEVVRVEPPAIGGEANKGAEATLTVNPEHAMESLVLQQHEGSVAATEATVREPSGKAETTAVKPKTRLELTSPTPQQLHAQGKAVCKKEVRGRQSANTRVASGRHGSIRLLETTHKPVPTSAGTQEPPRNYGHRKSEEPHQTNRQSISTSTRACVTESRRDEDNLKSPRNAEALEVNTAQTAPLWSEAQGRDFVFDQSMRSARLCSAQSERSISHAMIYLHTDGYSNALAMPGMNETETPKGSVLWRVKVTGDSLEKICVGVASIPRDKNFNSPVCMFTQQSQCWAYVRGDFTTYNSKDIGHNEMSENAAGTRKENDALNENDILEMVMNFDDRTLLCSVPKRQWRMVVCDVDTSLTLYPAVGLYENHQTAEILRKSWQDAPAENAPAVTQPTASPMKACRLSGEGQSQKTAKPITFVHPSTVSEDRKSVSERRQTSSQPIEQTADASAPTCAVTIDASVSMFLAMPDKGRAEEIPDGGWKYAPTAVANKSTQTAAESKEAIRMVDGRISKNTPISDKSDAEQCNTSQLQSGERKPIKFKTDIQGDSKACSLCKRPFEQVHEKRTSDTGAPYVRSFASAVAPRPKVDLGGQSQHTAFLRELSKTGMTSVAKSDQKSPSESSSETKRSKTITKRCSSPVRQSSSTTGDWTSQSVSLGAVWSAALHDRDTNTNPKMDQLNFGPNSSVPRQGERASRNPKMKRPNTRPESSVSQQDPAEQSNPKKKKLDLPDTPASQQKAAVQSNRRQQIPDVPDTASKQKSAVQSNPKKQKTYLLDTLASQQKAAVQSNLKKQKTDLPDTPASHHKPAVQSNPKKKKLDLPDTPASQQKAAVQSNRRQQIPDVPDTASKQKSAVQSNPKKQKTDLPDTPASHHKAAVQSNPKKQQTYLLDIPASQQKAAVQSNPKKQETDLPDTTASQHKAAVQSNPEKQISELPDTPASQHKAAVPSNPKKQNSDLPDTPASQQKEAVQSNPQKQNLGLADSSASQHKAAINSNPKKENLELRAVPQVARQEEDATPMPKNDRMNLCAEAGLPEDKVDQILQPLLADPKPKLHMEFQLRTRSTRLESSCSHRKVIVASSHKKRQQSRETAYTNALAGPGFERATAATSSVSWRVKVNGPGLERICVGVASIPRDRNYNSTQCMFKSQSQCCAYIRGDSMTYNSNGKCQERLRTREKSLRANDILEMTLNLDDRTLLCKVPKRAWQVTISNVDTSQELFPAVGLTASNQAAEILDWGWEEAGPEKSTKPEHCATRTSEICGMLNESDSKGTPLLLTSHPDDSNLAASIEGENVETKEQTTSPLLTSVSKPERDASHRHMKQGSHDCSTIAPEEWEEGRPDIPCQLHNQMLEDKKTSGVGAPRRSALDLPENVATFLQAEQASTKPQSDHNVPSDRHSTDSTVRPIDFVPQQDEGAKRDRLWLQNLWPVTGFPEDTIGRVLPLRPKVKMEMKFRLGKVPRRCELSCQERKVVLKSGDVQQNMYSNVLAATSLNSTRATGCVWWRVRVSGPRLERIFVGVASSPKDGNYNTTECMFRSQSQSAAYIQGNFHVTYNSNNSAWSNRWVVKAGKLEEDDILEVFLFLDKHLLVCRVAKRELCTAIPHVDTSQKLYPAFSLSDNNQAVEIIGCGWEEELSKAIAKRKHTFVATTEASQDIQDTQAHSESTLDGIIISSTAQRNDNLELLSSAAVGLIKDKGTTPEKSPLRQTITESKMPTMGGTGVIDSSISVECQTEEPDLYVCSALHQHDVKEVSDTEREPSRIMDACVQLRATAEKSKEENVRTSIDIDTEIGMKKVLPDKRDSEDAAETTTASIRVQQSGATSTASPHQEEISAADMTACQKIIMLANAWRELPTFVVANTQNTNGEGITAESATSKSEKAKSNDPDKSSDFVIQEHSSPDSPTVTLMAKGGNDICASIHQTGYPVTPSVSAEGSCAKELISSHPYPLPATGSSSTPEPYLVQHGEGQESVEQSVSGQTLSEQIPKAEAALSTTTITVESYSVNKSAQTSEAHDIERDTEALQETFVLKTEEMTAVSATTEDVAAPQRSALDLSENVDSFLNAAPASTKPQSDHDAPSDGHSTDSTVRPIDFVPEQGEGAKPDRMEMKFRIGEVPRRCELSCQERKVVLKSGDVQQNMYSNVLAATSLNSTRATGCVWWRVRVSGPRLERICVGVASSPKDGDYNTTECMFRSQSQSAAYIQGNFHVAYNSNNSAWSNRWVVKAGKLEEDDILEVFLFLDKHLLVCRVAKRELCTAIPHVDTSQKLYPAFSLSDNNQAVEIIGCGWEEELSKAIAKRKHTFVATTEASQDIQDTQTRSESTLEGIIISSTAQRNDNLELLSSAAVGLIKDKGTTPEKSPLRRTITESKMPTMGGTGVIDSSISVECQTEEPDLYVCSALHQHDVKEVSDTEREPSRIMDACVQLRATAEKSKEVNVRTSIDIDTEIGMKKVLPDKRDSEDAAETTTDSIRVQCVEATAGQVLLLRGPDPNAKLGLAFHKGMMSNGLKMSATNDNVSIPFNDVECNRQRRNIIYRYALASPTLYQRSDNHTLTEATCPVYGSVWWHFRVSGPHLEKICVGVAAIPQDKNYTTTLDMFTQQSECWAYVRGDFSTFNSNGNVSTERHVNARPMREDDILQMTLNFDDRTLLCNVPERQWQVTISDVDTSLKLFPAVGLCDIFQEVEMVDSGWI